MRGSVLKQYNKQRITITHTRELTKAKAAIATTFFIGFSQKSSSRQHIIMPEGYKGEIISTKHL